MDEKAMRWDAEAEDDALRNMYLGVMVRLDVAI
jgi:hypothetical protein